jgi:dTDP-4-amino-4,6-dideoxygalactose transaminase
MRERPGIARRSRRAFCEGDLHRVPFFDYPAVYRSVEEEALSVLTSVLREGKYILQEHLASFESNLAAFLGSGYALGVGNGTDAIFLALKAHDIGPGDEVILPAHTFIATASAVVATGAAPVLVDVRDDHLIDPAAVDSAVTGRTRALIPVQLNGRTCAMDNILPTATRHKLIVIEDAAQALGAEFDGKKAGTFGTVGCFSFYPAKLLGCYGDGGGVATSENAIYKRIERLRDHGRDDAGDVVEWSFNSRLDNIQAAILDLKLRDFPTQVQRRREIARMYHATLSKYDGLLLPPPPAEQPHFDVYQNYELECSRRDELRQFLADRSVGTIVQWGGKAVHQFKRLGFHVRLPVTERIMRNSLLLPMHAALTDADVEYVCASVAAFFDGVSR